MTTAVCAPAFGSLAQRFADDAASRHLGVIEGSDHTGIVPAVQKTRRPLIGDDDAPHTITGDRIGRHRGIRANDLCRIADHPCRIGLRFFRILPFGCTARRTGTHSCHVLQLLAGRFEHVFVNLRSDRRDDRTGRHSDHRSRNADLRRQQERGDRSQCAGDQRRDGDAFEKILHATQR